MQSMQVPVGALVDAPRNANVMSPAKYAGLKRSIERLGFIIPIIIKPLEDETWEIVDGHHRVRACRELGLLDVWSVVLESGDDPALVALAVNRLRGETDLATAAIIIEELLEGGLTPIDLDISGFSEDEIAALSAAIEDPDISLDDVAEADVPEEVGTPVARPFLMELTFRSKEDLQRARRALRKAVGKGGDLADGLLRLVDGA